MTNGQGARPGIWFWLAITASAVTGTATMLSRPGFEPSDLILPVAVAGIVLASLVSLRLFWPQAVGDPDRNSRVFIALGVTFLAIILAIGIVSQLR